MKGLEQAGSYIFVTMVIVTIFTSAALAQDLKTEEIVAKHLESIGTKEKREEINNRLAMGASSFESKLPSKKTGGKALIVSDGTNLYFIASLASKEYPYEKIGYFNEKISLPFVTSGTRSPLGAFIAEHEKLLSDGLFTGSISNTWALLNWQKNKALIKSAGTKKIDGRKVYVLEYFPKGVGSSEFSIRMFFDTENFRHVRTEYRHDIASKEDTFGRLGRQAGVKMRLTEDFGDFKDLDGMTLPHTYTLNYQTDSNSGTFEYIWGINLTQYMFNRKLDAGFFTFDVK
ncbi:MAG: hypothetical protein H7070_15195 [Saprospiraceae bacterium]|nr:hypothetical protein [Pyrinomonadaceae bacterium]